MGRSKVGATSGIHHDFHDNLYVMIRGSKRFRLWSPDAIEAMELVGTPVLVHPNGRVCYAGDEHTLADGSWLEEEDDDEMDNEDDDLDETIEGTVLPDAVDSDDDADAALEAALCAAIEGGAEHDDFDDGEDEDEEGSEQQQVKIDGAEAGELPKNFSRIGQGANDKGDHAPFEATPSVVVTLGPGDTLYLPCGWFHEVTSVDDGTTTCGGHLAMNYW